MKRGEVWTAAGTGDYGGKPRPVVIVQDDQFPYTASITVCALTTASIDAPIFRLPIEPNERNGLRSPCRMMVDKIISIPRSKLGARIGRLDPSDMLRFDRAAIVFVGLAADG